MKAKSRIVYHACVGGWGERGQNAANASNLGWIQPAGVALMPESSQARMSNLYVGT